MTDLAELLELERAGWRALSSGGEAAARWYGVILADEALLLLLVVWCWTTAPRSWHRSAGRHGTGSRCTGRGVVDLTDRVGVVAYRARAARGGQDYEALCTSTYVRVDGDWRLAVHQQTPL